MTMTIMLIIRKSYKNHNRKIARKYRRLLQEVL
jgi:hypothetical protein